MSRTFLLMGSGEFEPWSQEVERVALAVAKGDGRVIVVPTASAAEGDRVFDRWASMGLAHYEAMGVPAEVLPVKVRGDALREDLAERVADASMVFFSGGKPKRLAAAIVDTPVWRAVLAAIERGAVYAGCSAGAMVASQSRDGKKRPTGSWTFGLGLVSGASFGVHWDRVRHVPLAGRSLAARVPEGTAFVGVDERTAILGDGRSWTVYGNGEVQVRMGKSSRSHRAGDVFETPAPRTSDCYPWRQ